MLCSVLQENKGLCVWGSLVISTHLCCTGCLVLEHSTVCLFWDRIHIVRFFPFIKISLVATEEMWMDLKMDSQCLLFPVEEWLVSSLGIFWTWMFLHCDKDPLITIQTFQSGGLAWNNTAFLHGLFHWFVYSYCPPVALVRTLAFFFSCLKFSLLKKAKVHWELGISGSWGISAFMWFH